MFIWMKSVETFTIFCEKISVRWKSSETFVSIVKDGFVKLVFMFQ